MDEKEKQQRAEDKAKRTKRAAAALGFRIIECPGWEADDVLGTAAAMGDERGDVETYILTGDRDSRQLVTPTTTVVLAKTKEDVLFTPEVFRERFPLRRRIRSRIFTISKRFL